MNVQVTFNKQAPEHKTISDVAALLILIAPAGSSMKMRRALAAGRPYIYDSHRLGGNTTILVEPLNHAHS